MNVACCIFEPEHEVGRMGYSVMKTLKNQKINANPSDEALPLATAPQKHFVRS